MSVARLRPASLPDANGHFGRFGGRFVPETLMQPLEDLDRAYRAARADTRFRRRLRELLSTYAGRPTPLYIAERLTRHVGGARIYLKREDLCHTGAHKINNVLGQALLAQRMGKARIIAETGAGQHGVASATAAALLGLECEVYMGSVDIERQALNVFRMKLLGARVIPVESGSKTLKDAVNEALRDWVTNVRTTYYLLGSVMGPHPYPMLVRDFQRVIGDEARAQSRRIIGRLPDLLVACVGGGSNAMGLFWPFIPDRRVRIVGVEPGGHGIKSGKHGASLGSVMGPHPYPMMVRDFHRVIGEETRAQARRATGRLPDLLVACVGGGSNAIGLFWPFIGDRRVRIVGVEPGGHGIKSGKHGASLGSGAVGVLHGSMSYVLQNDDGQVAEAHSISAGLDYPGVGPEHSYYKDTGRFEYVSVTDTEALEGFQVLTRLEGIMPALESAHAVAHAMRAAARMKKTQTVVVGLSGRGDKDVHTVGLALDARPGHGLGGNGHGGAR